MPDRVRLFHYCLVGGTVALSFVLMFSVLRSFGMSEIFANAIAFLIAVAIQYIGQAALTFRRRLAEPSQMARFGVMIGLGLITSSLVASWLGPHLGLPDWASATCIAILLPVQNFILMSAWVFARHNSSAGDFS